MTRRKCWILVAWSPDIWWPNCVCTAPSSAFPSPPWWPRDRWTCHLLLWQLPRLWNDLWCWYSLCSVNFVHMSRVVGAVAHQCPFGNWKWYDLDLWHPTLRHEPGLLMSLNLSAWAAAGVSRFSEQSVYVDKTWRGLVPSPAWSDRCRWR